MSKQAASDGVDECGAKPTPKESKRELEKEEFELKGENFHTGTDDDVGLPTLEADSGTNSLSNANVCSKNHLPKQSASSNQEKSRHSKPLHLKIIFTVKELCSI